MERARLRVASVALLRPAPWHLYAGDADPVFAELWQAANDVDARDQRPFVKNLATVQGDERDIIVFSLGHAPVERRRAGGQSERYVPARFGPLAQRGGERRLNVAVSRAKSEQYVVASFAPELLHVGRSRHDGPRLFRAYLDFVHAINQGHGQGRSSARRCSRSTAS